jgi:hypothetical protein
MLNRRFGLAATLVAAMVGASCGPARAGESRAFLELFTSQGCSSCPPADKLLGELATDPALVAVSLPIDYWDYLGWKDTLASPAHSARQRAYARMRGDRQVYTPQIVVNGATHVVGSDRAAVERAIAQTDRNAAIMSVPVMLSMDGSNLKVHVGSGSGHPGGEVWLCPVLKSVTVAIGRGENSGRMVTYHNVVRRWVKLGDWTGTDSRWSIPVSEIMAGESDAAVVFVQQGARDKPGPILGAAFTPIGALTTENR